MMKKRIVALLLAGLMTTAALASCRVQGNPNQGGTEPDQNPPTNQTTPDPNQGQNPPQITWQDVDKSVFTINDVKLRKEATATSTALASVPKETELHCTKQSTSWYYVEYGEFQGYVSRASVTEANILGTDMVAIEGGSKVMYANAKTINVRIYPSDADFSSIVGSFGLNTEVTVVATNGTWYKIKYVKDGAEKEYYIHGTCLSDAKVTDPNDDTPYKHLFSDVAGTPTMYVSLDKVNFRVAPSTDENVTIIMSLKLGTAVTVLQTGTVNGKEWKKVEVYIPADKGVPAHWQEGYISADCLATTSGEQTIDDLVAFYGFTKLEKTMYVLAEKSVYVRSTPSLSNNENIIDVLASGKEAADIKAVKVLATGAYNDVNWYIIEHTVKEGTEEKTVLCFVGASMLTSDPNGKLTVTLEELLIKYPEFTACTTETKITTTAKANCYSIPNVSAEIVKELAAGTEVTLVAEETGSRHNIWYVVKDSTGALYFVGMDFFK